MSRTADDPRPTSVRRLVSRFANPYAPTNARLTSAQAGVAPNPDRDRGAVGPMRLSCAALEFMMVTPSRVSHGASRVTACPLSSERRNVHC